MQSYLMTIVLIIVLLSQRSDLVNSRNKKDSNVTYFVFVWVALIYVYVVGWHQGTLFKMILDAIVVLQSTSLLIRFILLPSGTDYNTVKDNSLRRLKVGLKSMEAEIIMLKSKNKLTEVQQKELKRLEEESEKMRGLIEWYESY